VELLHKKMTRALEGVDIITDQYPNIGDQFLENIDILTKVKSTTNKKRKRDESEDNISIV
jgi:hypothetical protein